MGPSRQSDGRKISVCPCTAAAFACIVRRSVILYFEGDVAWLLRMAGRDCASPGATLLWRPSDARCENRIPESRPRIFHGLEEKRFRTHHPLRLGASRPARSFRVAPDRARTHHPKSLDMARSRMFRAPGILRASTDLSSWAQARCAPVLYCA